MDKKKRRSKGVRLGRQQQIVCRFYSPTWEEVILLAEDQGVSTAEMIRILVRLGLRARSSTG